MEENLVFDIDLRDVVNFNVKSLQFFGYICPDYKNPISKVLYYTYSLLFIGVFCGSYLVSEIVNMIVVFGDMEKMTQGSFLLLTHLVQTLKLYVFVVYKSRIRRLINSINRDEFKPKNSEQYKLLVDDIKMSRVITKIFLSMGFGACFLWGLFPFLVKGEGDVTIKLPLTGWFPFDTEKSPALECVSVYLALGAMVTGLANISMDTFLSGIIMVISGQLKLLNNHFRILKQKYGKYNMRKSQTEVREDLIRNILHHKNILQLADEMTFLFTSCIMVQFVVSVIIICITMFQMSLVPIISLQFLSMTLYQGCIILEIFLWCYFGNEVILQSEKLTQSAYMCQWVDCSKEFKYNLLYFMTRSQIPLKLYAGGYFTLSLDTFTAIVKSSWSYFLVLNRVHSGKDDAV